MVAEDREFGGGRERVFLKSIFVPGGRGERVLFRCSQRIANAEGRAFFFIYLFFVGGRGERVEGPQHRPRNKRNTDLK